MKKVRIGIIGSGGIAQGAHLPGYAACPDAEVLAVADVSESTARAAAEKFNVPNVFTDYRKMLEMPEIDAVSVCTPNFMHRDATVAALNAGKHVLVEKPMAMNAKECDAMLKAAHTNGKKLQVGFNNRFGAGSQALKRFVESGDLGQVYYARAQALRRRGIPGWGVFTQKDKQGGGPLIDIGVHILDLTLWLMGHPRPVSVSGVARQDFGRRKDILGLMGQWDTENFTVEDFAVGFVRFENGATLHLESSFVANIENDVFNTQLFGTEGGCTLDPCRMFFEEHRTLVNVSPVHLRDVNTHREEMRAFVAAVKNDTPVYVTGEQAAMVTRIIDGIYKSSESGKEVKIETPAEPVPAAELATTIVKKKKKK
ncbi:MAG TPA: Gfo/Idh/MocA family oxidoreductase [Armatimonadota bacterium]|nr:Gfo/Idh/MocA family oxidoreductase [Armatimonadota bacterium]